MQYILMSEVPLLLKQFNVIGMHQIRPGEKCRMSTEFDKTW
jgi:hypothetical protein